MIDSTVELVCYTLSGRVPIRSYILHNPQQNCIHLHVIALNTQHFICSAHPPPPLDEFIMGTNVDFHCLCTIFIWLMGQWAEGIHFGLMWPQCGTYFYKPDKCCLQ